MQNAPRGAFCNTFKLIKLPSVIKIFLLIFLSGRFKTGFTVFCVCKQCRLW